MINWTNTTVTLDALKPWERNPKRIGKKQAQRLLEYWQRIGQFQTVAIGPNGEVYDGHQRLNVLKAAHGGKFEIDARQADRELTEVERQELVIQAHAGTTGTWDWDALSGWDTEALQSWGLDGDTLRQWQEDAGALGLMLDAQEETNAGADTEPQIDKAEAEKYQEIWQVKLGDVWQLGRHKIACIDSTDEVAVKALIGDNNPRYGMHDPPYGINVVVASDSGGDKPFGTGRIGFDNTVKTNAYSPVIGDDKPFDPSILLGMSKDCILWGANYYADKLPPKKGWIVWDKKGREEWRDNFSDCELAWSSLPIVTKIFRHTWMGMVQEGEREKRVHPTQKPVALFEKIMIELFTDDGIIIDFYLGSGTTLLAGERLGRRVVGCDLAPEYIATTIQRWVDLTGNEPQRVTG